MSYRAYKKDALIAATELGYSAYILKRIKAAKSEGEIQRIMHDARESDIEDHKPKRKRRR